MAEKRTQQMREITERLEQGVKELFTSEMYTEYLNTMSKFHNYSFNNTLLIAMQKPDATLVAGYQVWQKKFKRHVKRGEKAIPFFFLWRRYYQRGKVLLIINLIYSLKKS